MNEIPNEINQTIIDENKQLLSNQCFKDLKRCIGEVRNLGTPVNSNASDILPPSPLKDQQEVTTRTDATGNKITEFKNDKEGRTKETRFYDGKHGDALSETEYAGRPDKLKTKTVFVRHTVKIYEDGTKLTEYDLGNRFNIENLKSVYESPTGDYKKSTYEGRRDKKELVVEFKRRSDGKIRYTYYEGHPRIQDVYEYEDGKDGMVKETQFKDGSSEVKYKDGTIKKLDKGGKEIK